MRRRVETRPPVSGTSEVKHPCSQTIECLSRSSRGRISDRCPECV
jgi:hypothetical protein